MTLSIDDLVRLFEMAFYGAANGPRDKSRSRNAVAVVVTALRDEMCACQATPECDPIHMTTEDLWHQFNLILMTERERGDIKFGNKILAPRGDEAAACATSQTEGATDGNRQSERERHFPQGVQAVDGGGAETVGRCERCGGSLTRRDQSQLAFEVAILGDYEAGRGRHVGGEGNHGVSRDEAAGGQGENPVVSGASQMQTPAAAPDVCEWTDGGETYDTTCEPRDVLYTVETFKFCPACGKPIKFVEAAR